MPLLDKKELLQQLPVPTKCCLRQAVQWIAHDIQPVPIKYEQLIGIPKRVDLATDEKAREAKRQLCAAIMLGSIKPHGSLASAVTFHVEEIDGRKRRWVTREKPWSSSERQRIPVLIFDLMGVRAIDLDRNCFQAWHDPSESRDFELGPEWYEFLTSWPLAGPDFETAVLWDRVEVRCDELYAAFPADRHMGYGAVPAKRGRGRPVRYPQSYLIAAAGMAIAEIGWPKSTAKLVGLIQQKYEMLFDQMPDRRTIEDGALGHLEEARDRFAKRAIEED